MADTREVARTFIDAFNSHDPARIAAVHSETVVAVVPPDMTLRGREAVTAYLTGWVSAFPDSYLEVHDEIIADDTAIQQYTFRGSHTRGHCRGPGARDPRDRHRRRWPGAVCRSSPLRATRWPSSSSTSIRCR